VIPVRTDLYQTWFRTGLGVVPFGLACVLAERFWPARNLLVFFLQIAVLLPLLPLTLGLIFRKEAVAQAKAWLKRRKLSNRLNEDYEPVTTTIG
jgi:hypothetical protein